MRDAHVELARACGGVGRGAYIGLGYGLGDGLRRIVGTPGAILHGPSAVGRAETLRLVPAVRVRSSYLGEYIQCIYLSLLQNCL